MSSQMPANQLLDLRMHRLHVETESSLSHRPTGLMCRINTCCLSRDLWHSSFNCSLCHLLSNNDDLFIFLLWSPGFIDTIKKILGSNNSKTKLLLSSCPLSHWSHCHMDEFFLDIIFIHLPASAPAIGHRSQVDCHDIWHLSIEKSLPVLVRFYLRISSILTCFLLVQVHLDVIQPFLTIDGLWRTQWVHVKESV